MADDVKALVEDNAVQTHHREYGAGWFLTERAFHRILAALEAAQVPATDDEQPLNVCVSAPMGEAMRGRSSRVPVSRDELARATGLPLKVIMQIDEQYNLYPKADRKPGDSGEAAR